MNALLREFIKRSILLRESTISTNIQELEHLVFDLAARSAIKPDEYQSYVDSMKEMYAEDGDEWTPDLEKQYLEALGTNEIDTKTKMLGRFNIFLALITERIQIAIKLIDPWFNTNIQITINTHDMRTQYEFEKTELTASVALDGDEDFEFYIDQNLQAEMNEIYEASLEEEDTIKDPRKISDFYNLYKKFTNPTQTSPKALVLYTARPIKDRHVYSTTAEIPNYIWLTNRHQYALALANDFGGERDVYRVKILDKYVVKRLDDGSERHFQVITNNPTAPVIGIQRIE